MAIRTTPAAATAPAVATATTAAVIPTPYTGKKFTIGISNPFISSEYRTQMIQELKDTNAEYMALGITSDLVIESADTDVPEQLQQLQNLIAKNVDAILVNLSDINALNATLTDAVNKGIIVISVDQEIGATGVYDLGIDQKQWAMTSADWLAKKMNGYWTQDGMDIGAFQALLAANPATWPGCGGRRPLPVPLAVERCPQDPPRY